MSSDHIMLSFTATLDRPRELRLSLRALKRYSTATGKDIFRDGQTGLTTIDDFRVLVWSMARETDPAVTLSQLSGHITAAVVLDVSNAIKAVANGDTPNNQPDSTKN